MSPECTNLNRGRRLLSSSPGLIRDDGSGGTDRKVSRQLLFGYTVDGIFCRVTLIARGQLSLGDTTFLQNPHQ